MKRLYVLALVLAMRALLNPIQGQEHNPLLSFDQIELIANIETIGIVVTGDSLPDSAQVRYRQTGGIWRQGHPLLKMDGTRMGGSLFYLTPATTYDIAISHGQDSISATATTQPEVLSFVPTAILYVDHSAPPNGDGSQAAPFQTIQAAVDVAQPGTRVSVADGVYHESIDFPRSGTPQNWIQILADGDSAILDGSDLVTGNVWTPHLSVPNVWSTNIHRSIAYLARDTLRYYQYDDMLGLLTGIGHENVPMSEGWYMSETDSILSVRSLDDPNAHEWHVPRFNYAFLSYQEHWLWIEGFEIRFYGTSWGNAMYFRNASNLVVRHNRMYGNSNGIFHYWDGAENQGNNARFEFNDISDPPVDRWPWDAVKGTSMEGAGMTVAGHKGAIVRGNHVHQMFNGIYTGRWEDRENPGISFDVDAYQNVVEHMGDDAFEPEGTCTNNRFHHNIMDSVLVGVSLAPITVGPTWVVRNQITDCFGTWIKFSSNGDGVQLIYHNTSWHNYPLRNGLDFSGPAYNSTMRNNISRSTRYTFEITFTGNTGHNWDWDNWYTTTTDPNHFKWENVRYRTIANLCTGTGLECHGHEGEPGLVDPAHADLRLVAGSPNIDAGLRIPGINDEFTGTAPDIGAFEFGADSVAPVTNLTIGRSGADVVLRWDYALPGASFLVYSGPDASLQSRSLEGVTQNTNFVISGQFTGPNPRRFFQVVVQLSQVR